MPSRCIAIYPRSDIYRDSSVYMGIVLRLALVAQPVAAPSHCLASETGSIALALDFRA